MNVDRVGAKRLTSATAGKSVNRTNKKNVFQKLDTDVNLF